MKCDTFTLQENAYWMIRKILSHLFVLHGILLAEVSGAQTIIPNAGFESWTSYGTYSNPTGWDTPNAELMAIPFIGFTVVSKTTDHNGGSYAAKLETKHLTYPPLDIPGFMTCGSITINLQSGSFILSGGVPVYDSPTHLKGFFKFLPKGGDSCAIGIGLTRTVDGIADTVGMGSFSTKDTVTDWTPFSAWINYTGSLPPDTMNIIAISSAQTDMTVGTVLYVDDLYLDYTVGNEALDRDEEIEVYNDRETGRLMIFFGFENPEIVHVRLIDLLGKVIAERGHSEAGRERMIISYTGCREGVYILEIRYGGKIITKKYLLGLR